MKKYFLIACFLLTNKLYNFCVFNKNKDNANQKNYFNLSKQPQSKDKSSSVQQPSNQNTNLSNNEQIIMLADWLTTPILQILQAIPEDKVISTKELYNFFIETKTIDSLKINFSLFEKIIKELDQARFIESFIKEDTETWYHRFNNNLRKKSDSIIAFLEIKSLTQTEKQILKYLKFSLARKETITSKEICTLLKSKHDTPIETSKRAIRSLCKEGYMKKTFSSFHGMCLSLTE